MNPSTLAKLVSPMALAAMLVACGSQPSGTEMVVHPANDTPITHIANYDMLGDTAASPEGLYEVCSVRLGSCNLLYVDAATRQETYLCATPNCTHDSESCNSYLPLEEGRYGYQLFFFNGYLYAAQCTPIESQGPYLMRMDPDGTNREIVLELENGECFSGMLYGYGDRLLLQISRVDENGNSETCMEIFDPQTGERERLFSLQLEPGGKERASLMGAAGTSLIFLKSDEEGRQYYKVDLAKENPTLEQGQTNLLGPEFDETSLYCTVQGDYFCTYDIAASRLSWENLLTGQKKEFPLPQLRDVYKRQGNIDINRTVDDDEIAVYKVILDDDYTAITLASDNVFEYKDYQPQEVKEQASNEKIAAYKDTTKAEMEPYAQDFNAIIEGYEENMVVGFYSEGTIWGEEVGEYKSIAGTPLASDVSLYLSLIHIFW